MVITQVSRVYYFRLSNEGLHPVGNEIGHLERPFMNNDDEGARIAVSAFGFDEAHKRASRVVRKFNELRG